MYCVKCGVKLQEGAESCPLCHTPVWNPEGKTEEKTYPDNMPPYHSDRDAAGALAMTVLCLIAELVILMVCLKLYGELSWGGYAIFGILLFYIVVVLPRWFRAPRAEIFVPVDHVAAALYLLYVCVKTGGHWFMSFAFPVILIGCLITTAMICLLKYVRNGKAFIFGGFLLLLGGFSMLIEFFEHITFGTEMFLWSPYSLTVFGLCGLALLIAGAIPSLRRELRKRFFF